MTTLILSYIAIILLSTCLAVLVRRRLTGSSQEPEVNEDLTIHPDILIRMENMEATQNELKNLIKEGFSSREKQRTTERGKLTAIQDEFETPA